MRIDTPQEIAYYQHGGILHYVLRQLASAQFPLPACGERARGRVWLGRRSAPRAEPTPRCGNAAPFPMITIGLARPEAMRLAARGISCFAWQPTTSRDIASNNFHSIGVVSLSDLRTAGSIGRIAPRKLGARHSVTQAGAVGVQQAR